MKLFLLFLLAAAVVPGAHIDCAFVPTIGDMIALGSHGCRLDAPGTGFTQRDYTYSAQSSLGGAVPDAFDLQSAYFGGQIVSGFLPASGEILSATLGYTWDTGTDLVSLLSAGISSSQVLPAGAAITTEVCIGAEFLGGACGGTLAVRTSSASPGDLIIRHEFADLDPIGGLIGIRHSLTLPSGTSQQEYSFEASASIIRTAVPEPATITTSAVLIGLVIARYRRKKQPPIC